MDTGLHARLREAGADALSCAPLLFRPTVEADRAGLESLFSAGRVMHVHDRILDQLRELVRIQSPARRFTAHELDLAVKEHLAGASVTDHGVWVFYPWNGRLVHLLDKADFARVRTDRNRNKITAEEQAVLYTKRIGVIGLSVGQSVSLALALERSFGELRIADHDRLDLSNLNRLRSGVHNLGLPKTVNVAREIAEIDPFLKVTCFHEGITRDNLDRFLLEGGRLDVLVEECDSVDIKILARQRAKAHRIAVVMDTSDRGMIDVERFDLEPERPLLHGLIDHLDPDAAAHTLNAEDKLPFVAPMAGLSTLSKRMKASMIEVGHSLASWPQLASSVFLGGALACDVVRRILLGQLTASGRFHIDPETLLPGADGPAVLVVRSEPPPPLTLRSMRDALPEAHERTKPAYPLDEPTVAQLVEAGAWAPSGGNDQPWRFLHEHGRLYLFHEPARSHSAADPGQLVPMLSLGACVENLLVKAAGVGIALSHELIHHPSEPRLVAVFGSTGPIRPVEHGLSSWLTERCTNRRMGDGSPLGDAARAALHAEVQEIPGALAHLVEGAERLDRVAVLCGEAERLRFLNATCHHELFTKEVRWTDEDAQRTRDGLDLATFEMGASEVLGMQVASDPDAIALVRRWNAGRVFMDLSGPAIRSSSAVLCISMPRMDREHALLAGRAMERAWLRATGLGLAVHPISAPILLGLMAHSAVFDTKEREAIGHCAGGIREVFATGDRSPAFLLRLFRAPAPSVRSLRLPLNTIWANAPAMAIP
ncbi:MAG: Rv1355c family protein [Flavobacteriales bacterium]|nr:Rv1355c family protein [Flavobacteriales bacterium]